MTTLAVPITDIGVDRLGSMAVYGHDLATIILLPALAPGSSTRRV